MPTAWEEAESEVLRENTAQDIHQQLEELENQKDKYLRRWIWELFQNALDAANGSKPVNVVIRRDADSLIFTHDGAPFDQKEILHLIYHGSTKRERKGVIGRYGTGFMTTHVLSRLVKVSGNLTTGERFSFVLDRTGRTPSELARAMRVSFDNLRKSLESVQDQPNRTAFEYHLDNIARKLVDNALQEFRTIAPFVLAFNPALGSIEVIDDNCNHLAVLASRREPSFEDAHFIEIGDPRTGHIDCRCFQVTNGDFSIIIGLRAVSDKYAVAFPAGIPRLFAAFPLFGTETLPLPFLLNCPSGKPTEKRDGLFLGPEESEDNRQNKKFIEQSWQLFKAVLQRASAMGWDELFNFARLGPAPAYEWLDTRWFDNLSAAQLIECIARTPIVKIANDHVVPPVEIAFPVFPEDANPADYVCLVRDFCGANMVPADEVALPWIEIVDKWEKLQLPASFNLTIIRLSDLAGRVSSLKHLSGLNIVLEGHEPTYNELKSLDWLNSFFTIAFASKQLNILDRERLLPDQTGVFRLRSELKRDQDIDEELKLIGRDLGKDVRTELLNQSISRPVQDLLAPLNSEDVSASLVSLVTTSAKSECGTKEYRKANPALLAWLASKRRLEPIRSFPLISSESDPKTTEKLVTARDWLLAPVDIWPTTAKPFAALFPANNIASSIYAKTINKETWTWLGENGLFLLDPIIQESRDITADDLAGLFDQPLQSDQEDLEHAVHQLKIVDIAHLNLKDKGIIDSIRGSKTKTLLFLNFIMRHVLPNTAESLGFKAARCQCGRDHSIHSAIWVSTLKDRQWVYERKGHSGRPTAANLARIWKDDLDLIAAIKQSEVILFLRRLEINASEIQRNTSTMPESDSIDIEKAMVALLAASSNDVHRMQLLADIASSDPDFLNDYEEKIKQRERIRFNQNMGISIEGLFKSVFRSPDLLALGLNLRRTGWGSDFCVEHDLLDENGEVAFELYAPDRPRFFLELKCTFGSAVSMSALQGQKAAENSKSFGLCVLQLEEEKIDVEFVKKNIRFVLYIGDRLKEKVKAVEDIATLQAQIKQTTSIDEIDVLIEGSDVHYSIKQPVWASGLDLKQFIAFLLRFFRSDVLPVPVKEAEEQNGISTGEPATNTSISASSQQGS